ncbi:bleomycin resistance family protein [Flavobacterium collinsii]|uniref:Glyoxalase/fosfomycin resistance/dioxygenase domain-containing protein n=1 Tax=Flavobacterium collinsii TaxID=1114861 RepID=A0A9W4TMF4_9FLAO|nr:bleomycin resistance family protein [Flavobacterium collinsii]CAI2768677.1 protein of unknown function [Flavobacterium collinsii]
MKVSKLVSNFEAVDIKKTVEFYAENLEFSLFMAMPESQDGIEKSFAEDKEYVYAMMQKDNMKFMFQRSDTFRKDVIFSQNLPIVATFSLCMGVEEMEELYRTLKSKKLAD